MSTRKSTKRQMSAALRKEIAKLTAEGKPILAIKLARERGGLTFSKAREYVSRLPGWPGEPVPVRPVKQERSILSFDVVLNTPPRKTQKVDAVVTKTPRKARTIVAQVTPARRRRGDA